MPHAGPRFVVVVVALTLALGTAGAGCNFLGGVPPDATVLCVKNSECAAAQVCDLFTHTCVAAGTPQQGPGAVPRVVDVHFDPAKLASGTAHLVVVADQPLDPNTPPVLAFADGTAPLSLAPEAAQDDAWTFLVDATSAAPGAYPLASVTVVDTDGARGTTLAPDAVLLIDRTAPHIDAFTTVDVPASGIYADIAPDNVVASQFFVDEPLDVALTTVQLGALVGPCALDPAIGSLAYSCTLTLTSGGDVADGPATLHLHAVDVAGNATEAVTGIVIDVGAPSVVTDSVTLRIEQNGIATAVAGLHSRITVGFLASEDLGVDPAVSLDVDGVLLPFAIEGRSGRHADVSLLVSSPIDAGAYPVVATLTDRFGHVSSQLVLPLPAPNETGVPFVVDASGGACPIPAGDTILCADLDGDGHPASAACANGGDLDDADPTSFPGAPEIPGDGRDNDFIGGDAPVDGSDGVFVDVDSGDDAADGSPGAPVQTVGRATALASQQQKHTIFLAAGSVPYDNGGFTGNMLGGLDPTTWAPSGAHSRFANLFLVCSGGFVSGVDTVNGNLAIGGGVLVDAHVATVDVSAASVIVDASVGFLSVSAAAGGTRVLRAAVGSVNSNGDLFVDRSTITAFSASGNFASTTITNSVIDAPADAPFNCAGCPSVSLFHDTVVNRTSAATTLSITNAGPITLVDNVLLNMSSAVLLSIAGSQARLAGNGLFQTFNNIGSVNGTFYGDAASLNACSGTCSASANVYGNPDLLLAAGDHLNTTSTYIDAAADALAEGAPATVLVDVDGQCRYDDVAADIGADEVR